MNQNVGQLQNDLQYIQTNKQINNKYRLWDSSLISAGLAHATAIIIHQQQQVETSVPQFRYLETVRAH